MTRVITGVVSSRPGDKSIIVTIKAAKLHPIYKKRYTRTSKYMAHDEQNQAGVGDLVTIAETKPISARKRFILTGVISKAGIAFKDEDATSDVAEEVIGHSSAEEEETAK